MTTTTTTTTTTDWRRLRAVALAAATVLVGAAASGDARSEDLPSCDGGKVRVDDGCCWPGQRWVGGRCEGLPRCTGGLLPSKGTCVTRADYAAELGRKCAKMPVGFSAVAGDEPGRRACDELATMVPDGEPVWTAGCERGDADSCLLLGSARLGYRTAGARVELWVARCRTNDCNGHRRSYERIGFAGGTLDEAAARTAFERACKAGSGPGCLEFATLGTLQAKGAYREACVGHGEQTACAEAGYRIGIVGNVKDTELFGAITKSLAPACDAGSSAACNNLGFFTERKRVENPSPEAAGERYRQACEKGSALGCANLVMFATRDPSFARSVVWPNAQERLVAACDEARDAVQHECLALAISLQRGLGGEKDLQRGRGIASRLCRAGFRDACIP